MKHAYLIMAHEEFEVLRCLVSALDDPRNDLYVHIDKKVGELPQLETAHAGLFVLEERIDIRWADVSQVECELLLFHTASQKGSYAYYHLLSGVDMPLKTQDEIHRFFKKEQGKQFIGFNQHVSSREVDRKVQRYHLFPRHFRIGGGMLGLWRRGIRFLAMRLQLALHMKRHRKVDFRKGLSWVSITHDFLAFVLLHEKSLLKMYAGSFCADEIFLQTLCWNSHFRGQIYDSQDEGRGSMRMIVWKDNRIINWENEDFDRLMNSEAMFARKFGSAHDDLVLKILERVRRNG